MGNTDKCTDNYTDKTAKKCLTGHILGFFHEIYMGRKISPAIVLQIHL